MSTSIPAWMGGVLESVPEIDVHRRGLRHPAVAVFVTRGTHILIRSRPRAVYLVPGLWSSTCHAHPVRDEAHEICAMRLLHEAALVQTAAPRYCGTAEYRSVLAGGFVDHERVDVFSVHAVVSPGDAASVASPDLSERRLVSSRVWPDAVWIDVEDLLAETHRRAERFTPLLHTVLAQYLPFILDR